MEPSRHGEDSLVQGEKRVYSCEVLRRSGHLIHPQVGDNLWITGNPAMGLHGQKAPWMEVSN